MIASFWSGLGQELARHWATRLLSPALTFWLGGFAAVWWHAHGDGVTANGWATELQETARPFEDLPAIAQAFLLIAVLMLIAASALAAERVTLPLLRLLEGHWYWRLRGRRTSRRRKNRARSVARRDELNLLQRRGALTVQEYAELRRLEAAPEGAHDRLAELRARRATGFGPREAAELARLRLVLHQSPDDDALAMPTRLGDILRAAERRPGVKYGLDASVCWTALWFVVPTDARTETAQARAKLDSALRMWLWGALFIVWTPWAIWALPIAILVPTVAYYGGMLGAAALFGELVVTCFDLYRMQLYDALHLPRPTSPDTEPHSGAQVTNLLWGGVHEKGLLYARPQP